MAVPTIVQSIDADVASGTSLTSGTLPAPATAGNALVLFIAGDKNTGTLTQPGGWTKPVELVSTSVCLYATFGTAVGGETSVAVTLGSAGGGNGNTCWLVELAQAGSGAWGVAATTATTITSEATVTTTVTGTTGAATRDGLGLACLAVDSAANIVTGTWTSVAFTNRFDAPITSGVGGTGAGIHVGSASVLSAATTASTWTTTSGTADQLSAALIVISRAPLLEAALLEVEFVPGSGVFADISDRCSEVVINRPRPGIAEAVSLTTLTARLDNAPDSTGFCPFTPDSPVGTHYPNVERDRRIRFTAPDGASGSVRFLGWSDQWVPDMSEGGVGTSTVTLTGSCVLGRYARRTLLSYFGETVINDSRNDYYPFDDPTDSTITRCLSGDPVNHPPRDGAIIVPTRPPGSAILSAPDGGHLTDGQIDFSRGDDNAPAPVVLMRLRPGELISSIQASFRLSSDPAGLTDDVMAGYDINGLRLWRWTAGLTSGKIVWRLHDDADVVRSFYDTTAGRDDAWHYWHLAFIDATGTAIFLTDKGGGGAAAGSSSWTYDPRPVAYLVVGGQMVPQRLGKQTNTLQGGVSSILVRYVSGATTTDAEFAVPAVTTVASRVVSFLDQQGADLSSLTGGDVTPGVGSDARELMYTNATRNLLDRWNEHAITVGGHLSTLPDGRRRYLLAEQCRPTTVSLTLDAADDLDIPAGGWQSVKDERPTRVIGVGPVGSIEVIDAATEAETGLRLDGPTLQTSAGTISLARAAAASVMNPRLARLSQFGLDLALTGTDRYADVMALTQSDRIRVTGLPAEYLGLTYQDVYASGWTETYTGEYGRAIFVFDTDMADDPPEAVLDDAEYGRIGIGDGNATITGGTCVGITGTGTVIITSTSPLTTVAGEYPMDLDWLGERITVSVPGGSSSPQTCTVTARGVAPTVARVHATGHAVEIWHAARLAL